ncbi:F-box only protein 43-like [Amphiura filiformis]|uniref:F-box only protein 43-like n=1 Tax=Amphiura filiformis TaxID=82378 RepID=UPI003B22424B
MDTSVKAQEKLQETGNELTARNGTKHTGSDHDHQSGAKHNQSAVHVNKTLDSGIVISTPNNMREKQESDFSQTSENDSGYQSDISSCTIGHRVGMGSFDLFTELTKVEPNLVRNIVQKVGDATEDLISISQVSPEWHSTLKTVTPKEATIVDRHQREQQQEQRIHKENYPKEKTEKRCVTEAESPLTEVQEFGTPQLTSTPRVTAKPESSDGNYHKYYEAGQKLFVDESLTKCARHGCQAPAKHLLNKQKGQCTSYHCQFEFCTNCRCEFHGGKPCKVFESKSRTKKPTGIGSKKSKGNLSRLGKL